MANSKTYLQDCPNVNEQMKNKDERVRFVGDWHSPTDDKMVDLSSKIVGDIDFTFTGTGLDIVLPPTKKKHLKPVKNPTKPDPWFLNLLDKI